jgi:hypothetical protein
VLYKPMIAGFAKLHYVDSKLALDDWQTSGWLAPLDDGGNASWEDANARRAVEIAAHRRTLRRRALRRLAGRGAARGQLRRLGEETAGASLRDGAQPTCCSAIPSRRPRSGRIRGRLPIAPGAGAREKRDAAVAELRKRWQAKLLQLQDQLRRGEERREREQAQLSQQKMQTAVSIGSSILGALLGRKTISAANVRRAGSAASSAAAGTRVAGRGARRGEHRSPAAAPRGHAARSRGRSRAARDQLDATTIRCAPVDVPARKSDIAVGRSGAGLDAVAQGRRRLSRRRPTTEREFR